MWFQTLPSPTQSILHDRETDAFRMTLLIQYDNRVLQDGFGAQALRLVALKGIADYFGCTYLNADMLTEHEFFSTGASSIYDLKSFANKVNEFFTFGEVSKSTKPKVVIRERDLSSKALVKYLLRYKYSRDIALLQTVVPYSVVNRFPKSLSGLPKLIRDNNAKEFRRHEPLDLVIHIRMGYGASIVKNGQGRHLPFEYYLRLLKSLAEKGLVKPSDRIIIHTDLPREDSKWNVKTSVQREELISQGLFLNGDEVEVKGENLEAIFSEFREFNLTVKYCADWFETLIDMSQAETLVMARSAFSYLAATLNPNKVIWPNNHGHPLLHNWISSKTLGVDANHFSLISG